MSDWIGLGIIILVLFGALWGMSRLGKTPKPISSEEYERRVAEGGGTMSSSVAGMMYAIQKLINPKAAEAVEIQKDFKAGYYDETEQAGEGDEPEDAVKTDEPLQGDHYKKLAEGEDA